MAERGKREEERGKSPSGEGCPHVWRLEEPNGPRAAGVCKRCGAAREFGNSPEEAEALAGGSPRRRDGEGLVALKMGAWRTEAARLATASRVRNSQKVPCRVCGRIVTQGRYMVMHLRRTHGVVA